MVATSPQEPNTMNSKIMYTMYNGNVTTMPQSSDDSFIQHNDNHPCYNNLNPADDDTALMYKINSNNIDIATAMTKTVSTTATIIGTIMIMLRR